MISDLGLPDGSGISLIRQLRAVARERDRPERGTPARRCRAWSRRAGFMEYLVKPADEQQVDGGRPEAHRRGRAGRRERVGSFVRDGRGLQELQGGGFAGCPRAGRPAAWSSCSTRHPDDAAGPGDGGRRRHGPLLEGLDRLGVWTALTAGGLGISGGRPGPPRRLARRITPHQTGEARQPKRQNPFSNASFIPGQSDRQNRFRVRACQAASASGSSLVPSEILARAAGFSPAVPFPHECSRNSGEKEAVKDQ